MEAVAYLITSQVFFYHVISTFNPSIPQFQLDAIKKPSDVARYFDKLSHFSIYQPVFSYNVLESLEFTDIEPLHSLIKAIKRFKTDKLNKDVLGTVFHDLIPLETRKKVAAYYTNPLAADLLAWLSINDQDCTIVDPACGSGGLLVAAYQRKKTLIQGRRVFTNEDHKRFLNEEIKGYDVMPFAASTAASLLALQEPKCTTAGANIKAIDSTTLEPSQKPASLVIMNPPFTRQERIGNDRKKLLEERFDEYKGYIHGQMSLFGYFIFLADKLLREGGRMALVLPASILRARSCQGIRELWNERYHVECIITGRKKLNFSDSTWKREILAILNKEKKGQKTMRPTKIISIESLPETQKNLEDLVKKIKNATGNVDYINSSIKYISQDFLRDASDWYHVTRLVDVDTPLNSWELVQDAATGLKPFHGTWDLDKNLIRGIETRGDLKFQKLFMVRNRRDLLRKEDEWFLEEEKMDFIKAKNRHSGNSIQVPTSTLMKGRRSFSNINRMDAYQDYDYIIAPDHPIPGAPGFFGNQPGRVQKRINEWKRYVRRRQGHLFIMRRFVINAPGTTHLCYHSRNPLVAPATSWVFNASGIDAKILCLWFNSSLNLVQLLANRLEDVWIDVHKYQLKNFLVPDVSAMERSDKLELEALFHKVASVELPSMIEQYLHGKKIELKKEIDRLFLKILGIPPEQAKILIGHLHGSIKNELNQINEMDKKRTSR